MNLIPSGSTLAVWRERKVTNEGPKFTGKTATAVIPNEEFEPLRDAYLEAGARLMATLKNLRSLLTPIQFRDQHAAHCQACNLCMVCAGRHRQYCKVFDEIWPPGKKRCFANLLKQGNPLRETPCALCEEHDQALRTEHRRRRQLLSEQSSIRAEINKLDAQRRSLFAKFLVDSYEFEG